MIEGNLITSHAMIKYLKKDCFLTKTENFGNLQFFFYLIYLPYCSGAVKSSIFLKKLLGRSGAAKNLKIKLFDKDIEDQF